MIIKKIDIVGIAIFEAKNDPPVSAGSNCPKALEVTLHWMQSKTGSFHILRP